MNVRIYVWVGILAMAFPIAAVATGGKVSVADYRWRSDDGGESGASWKADPHTPITGVKRDTNIRLRMAFVSDGKIAASPTVKYATSTNGPWSDVRTEIGRPFRITSTTWYADGDLTTAQIPVGGGKTFTPGRCVESPSIGVVISLANSNEYTEGEICLQATPYAARNATYYFDCRVGTSPTWCYPQLTIEDADPTNPPVDFYVDDTDANASVVGQGDVLVSGYTNGAWGGKCKYIGSTNETAKMGFRWIPNLPEAGEYNVYGRWTYGPYRGQHIPYSISHAGGTNEVLVNQRDPALAGQWNLLGTHTFNAGTNGWVELDGHSGQACADAVRFELVGGAPLADADGDGMLDLWESTYLGGTSASPTADADLDSMNNLQEFLAGTNPTNAVSVLRIVDSELRIPNSELTLRWLSSTGKKYTIQKSTNLTSGFTVTEAIGIDANPPTNTQAVTLGASGSGFYRVKLETGN